MTKVGLYERISDDRELTEAGVSRQDKDCRRLAKSLGWTVAQVYRENDTSAFARRTINLPDGTSVRRVVRPEFRRMLDDLAAGTVDAVIAYDLDRIARDPRDLEDLIDVCETTKRPARSVTGNLDLSTDGGITMARVAVAMANQASRDTARRVRRAQEENAARGRWNGGGRRPYGYTPDRSATVPAEAKVIREMARRVLAGEGINGLAKELRDRKVPNVNGKPWNRTSLRVMLTGPHIAGRLVYRGQEVGEAPWPAILDVDTWRAVCAEIAGRPRQDSGLRHYLTGVLVCALCGDHLRGNGDAYICRGCHRVSIHRERTESLVAGLLFAYVRSLPTPRTTKPAPPPDDSQLAELAAMWGAQEITLAEYRKARAEIVKRLQATKPAPVKVPAWASRDDLEHQWPDLSPLQQRTVARSVLASIRVKPTGPGLRVFDPSRLDVTWR